MTNMMYNGGYGMMSGGVVGVVTLVLFWVLMAVAIAALWAWYKKNK